jgi:hypothetical protein
MHDISAVNMASGTDHKIGNMNNPTTINFAILPQNQMDPATHPPTLPKCLHYFKFLN